MSPRFITQLSKESPSILLVGKETSLRRKIESFLIRQGLDVIVLDSISNQDDLNKVSSKKFYKIIALGVGEKLKKDISYLKQYDNLLVINLFYTIEQNSYITTYNNLIAGQDIVSEDNSSYLLLNPVVKNINKNILIDPKIDFFLQSEESFFNTVKNLILSPQKQKTVIKGKQHSSEVVLEEISRLLSLFKNINNLQIKKDLHKSFNKNLFDFEIIKNKVEALPSLLEGFVRNISVNEVNQVSQIKKTFHQKTLSKPNLLEIKQPKITKKSNLYHQEVVPKPNKQVEFNIPHLVNTNVPKQQVPQKATLNKVNNKVINQVVKKNDLNKIDNTNIDDKLNNIFKVKRVDQKVKLVKNFVKETKKIKKKTKKNKFLFAIGVFFTFIGVSLLSLAGLFIISTSNLEKELTKVFFNFSQSQEVSQVDYSNVSKSSIFLEKQIILYEQFVPPEVFIDSKNLIEISGKIVEYNSYKDEFNDNIENLVTSFLGKDLFEYVLDGQKQAKTAQAYYETASRLLSRLNDFKDTQTQQDKQEKITNFILYIESQKKSLQIYQQLSPIFDSLFGKTGKKNYALVFQNNQELRPTGGFIQAVALLTVDKGMLVDSQVFSSYELDKNLGGAVVPPDEIIKLLGETKWYLRDSNWDPDFPSSSKQISWFLEQETNKKIDGVIGINLFVLKNILKEMGPLELDDYNEIITDKNIFERSEFHSEIKLVESSDIEDYQANLLKFLLRDLVLKGQDNPGGLLSALSKSISQKQMTISMDEDNLSKTFSLLGWSGELINPQCPNQLNTIPCQVDSLIINEANIGINKANYHTSREDSHVIEIKSDLAKHTRKITLNNTAFSNAWPKGNYKSYFRFYVPLSIDSLSIQIDGQSIDEDKYNVIEQDNHKILSILIEVPIKTQKEISVDYIVPIEFSLPYSYVFFNQKQPGTDGVLPKVIINHDSALSPTLIAPQADIQGNSIIFDNLDEDHTFVGVSFK